MTLLIRPIESDFEINYCVDLYANLVDEHLLPVSIERSRRVFKQLVISKKFIRIGEIEGKIHCWIFAQGVQTCHVAAPIFQQQYYASDLKGTMAVRAVVQLHDAMLEEAKRQAFKLVMSQGSCFDETNVFARILEKNGWKRRGHTAVKILE